jgi:hypothetical protein
LAKFLDFLVGNQVHDTLHRRGVAVGARAALDVEHLPLGVLRVLPGELGIFRRQRLLGILAVTGDAGLFQVERLAVGQGRSGESSAAAAAKIINPRFMVVPFVKKQWGQSNSAPLICLDLMRNYLTFLAPFCSR